MEQQFSVLMSVYYKESPLFLKQSLDSIFSQTLKSNEVVLVEDGPLTLELNGIVDQYSTKHPELKVVKLKNNQGLGKALNEGLKHCSNELVLRADTDDISKPNRFITQVSFMETHPEIDVCSAGIDEFIGDTNNVVSTRTLPVNHDELFRFGQKRNPINHPVSIFRKSKVEAVGNYQHFYLFEDYYLWARMMVNGARFHNIKESLLYFRSSPEMMKRRGGWKYAMTEVKFQIALHHIGYISIFRMFVNIVTRFGVRIMPNKVRAQIYAKLLRK